MTSTKPESWARSTDQDQPRGDSLVHWLVGYGWLDGYEWLHGLWMVGWMDLVGWMVGGWGLIAVVELQLPGNSWCQAQN